MFDFPWWGCNLEYITISFWELFAFDIHLNDFAGGQHWLSSLYVYQTYTDCVSNEFWYVNIPDRTVGHGIPYDFIVFFLWIYKHIRWFQIKRVWFCRFYYKNSYLEIRKSLFMPKHSQYCIVFRVYIYFSTKIAIFH